MSYARQACIVVLLLANVTAGDERQPIEITDPVDYKAAVIDYHGEAATDAISQLKSRITKGEVALQRRGDSGYLLDLLAALNIPVTSQMLVFSKTSLQQDHVTPKNPRAIYFNDEVSVAWIPGAPLLEIVAQDPVKGALFYTVSQSGDDGPSQQITWRREQRCLECHASTATLNVPGHMLRSFQVDELGERDIHGEHSDVTHATKYEKRWGGWYVTGKSPKMAHAGNLFGEEDASRHERDTTFRGTLANLTELVDLAKYPSAHSDLVALLVLEHQLHFYNLVTRVQYEHRLGQRSDAEERLARYALMEDEAPLLCPVEGSTKFATSYQSRGPRDSRGRSLQDLNLQTRLYEHRLSPLVHSRAFRSLPEDVQARLWKQFRQARGDGIESVPSGATAP